MCVPAGTFVASWARGEVPRSTTFPSTRTVQPAMTNSFGSGLTVLGSRPRLLLGHGTEWRNRNRFLEECSDPWKLVDDGESVVHLSSCRGVVVMAGAGAVVGARCT